MTNDTINKLFNEGLINNGDIMIVVDNGQTDITKTVSLYPNFTYFIGQLKAVSEYKNSNGCFIPKSYIGKSEGEIKPIYYKNNEMILLPEFIYGYLPVEDNNLREIIRNPKYENARTYSNKGLYYDDGAYYKLREILLKVYLDTYYMDGYEQAH